MPLNARQTRTSLSPYPRGECTCGSLRKASRRLSQFYDAALAPLGIRTTQYSILSELERSSLDAPLTMCQLAAVMAMDRSTLGHNLRPLQRDDLVMLQPSATDGRKRYVQLTRKGKTLLHKSRGLWLAAESRFEKIFGKQPAADLRAVLRNIVENDQINSVALR
jgi:DNA-binding MarR family transcriptional regulator